MPTTVIWLEAMQIARQAVADAAAAQTTSEKAFPDGHFMDPSTTNDQIAAHLTSLGFHRVWRYR